MVKINSHFIANFNKGRNIQRNVETLGLLWKVMNRSSEEDQALLQKPIIILIGSILEAVMFDFHYKVHSFTKEIKGDLTTSQIDMLTRNDDDEFKRLLGKFRANNILELKGKDQTLYEDIEELRLLRNRIHIQNTENSFEEYECDAFTSGRRTKAEALLEKFLKIMSARYGRGENYRYVDDFCLPWEPYIDGTY